MTVDARAAARRPIHWAVGGALVVATALVPSAESAAAEQTSEVALRYACPFPSGPEEVDVVVSAVLPTSVRTGEEVRPSQVAVEVDLEPTALARFAELDAATLSAVARLTVRNTVGDKSADASWQDLTAPPVALPGPEGGSLTLTATGDVPTVSFGSPGRATLAPAELALSLSSLTGAGEPTTPPGLDVVCEPAPGQEPELAAITVRGDGDPTAPAPQPSTSDPAPDPAPTRPAEGLSPGAREKIEALTDERLEALEGEDPGSCPIEIPPEWVMTTAETYAAGYANAAKLDGAAALGPAFMKVVLNKRYINDSCASTVDVSSEVNFDYRGRRQLPPTKATFLSYGFMPTTATMTLEQVGPPAAIHTHTVTNTPTYPEETTVTAQLVMRLSDVEVNGVPLDVGPDCRTERPFEQVLRGYGQSYPPAGYLVAYGGTLTGYAHIPPFEGCGVGEDLDPIFTSAISSPGKKADNYTKMTQAPLCVATNPEGPDCPPRVPDPER
ncbi:MULTISPECIES: DUF6801 domain-containing protein [Streptomyces]|uniref:DUF6801 domain-containing protein n=3 Tax=Streptomyces griseus TaxID=1911 RepID=B1VU27_STRGG|nr:DUF6801 domain-containing protein [Streptomyces griseus]MYR10893.1 hypothetical protein [Streptomyces sp. SID724]BAG17871.1 hypothetical protein SGR_1042 [Streptomyces griseus subsp. griseus NBRC 13350]SED63855.1 hypothetical protein SAMN04490359_1218 [Streptomyces griseus]SQA26283.1 Secreted protein [Streptomyces griseus]